MAQQGNRLNVTKESNNMHFLQTASLFCCIFWWSWWDNSDNWQTWSISLCFSRRIWQLSQSQGVGGSILGVQFDSLETRDRQQTDYKFEQRGTPIFWWQYSLNFLFTRLLYLYIQYSSSPLRPYLEMRMKKLIYRQFSVPHLLGSTKYPTLTSAPTRWLNRLPSLDSCTARCK